MSKMYVNLEQSHKWPRTPHIYLLHLHRKCPIFNFGFNSMKSYGKMCLITKSIVASVGCVWWMSVVATVFVSYLIPNTICTIQIRNKKGNNKFGFGFPILAFQTFEIENDLVIFFLYALVRCCIHFLCRISNKSIFFDSFHMYTKSNWHFSASVYLFSSQLFSVIHDWFSFYQKFVSDFSLGWFRLVLNFNRSCAKNSGEFELLY